MQAGGVGMAMSRRRSSGSLESEAEQFVEEAPEPKEGEYGYAGEFRAAKVVLSASLLAVGVVLQGFCTLVYTGILWPGNRQVEERVVPVLVLGLITFVPGCWGVFMTVMALLGVEGYSHDSVPGW